MNDSLKDFATWDFTVTVPKGRTVMANGVLVSKTDSGDKTTWHWRETSPMVSYLATVTNGFFELRTSTLANGLPRYDAVDPQTRFYGEKTPRPQDAWDNLAVEPEAVGFLSNLYGAVPVRERRRGRRLGAERVLRARDPDEAATTTCCRTSSRSSTSSRISGSATRSCSTTGPTCG